MGQIGHVAFKTLTAYIAVKYLCYFFLPVCLDFALVLLYIEGLLSAYQHTFVPTGVNN